MSVSYANAAKGAPATSSSISTSTVAPAAPAIATDYDNESITSEDLVEPLTNQNSPKLSSSSTSPKKEKKYLPAPVPTISPWAKVSSASSKLSDEVKWPTPDQLTEEKTKKQNLPLSTNGKEKWVPLEIKVTLPPKNKKKVNQKKKFVKKTFTQQAGQPAGQQSTQQLQNAQHPPQPHPQHSQQHQPQQQSHQESQSQQAGEITENTDDSSINSNSSSFKQKNFKNKKFVRQFYPQAHQQQPQHSQQQAHQFLQRKNIHPHNFNPQFNPHFNPHPNFHPNFNTYNYNSYQPHINFNNNNGFVFSKPVQLSRQINYYFSVENLIKDIYLRRQMDTEGWVPLSVVLKFRRIGSILDSDDSSSQQQVNDGDAIVNAENTSNSDSTISGAPSDSTISATENADELTESSSGLLSNESSDSNNSEAKKQDLITKSLKHCNNIEVSEYENFEDIKIRAKKNFEKWLL